MEPEERFKELHRQVERTRLGFIVTEIDTAFTLARIAETLYGTESINHAERLLSKAWKAYDEAVNQLKKHPTGPALRGVLTARLEKVRVVLDGLPSNEKRKFRVVRKNGKS